MSRARTKAGAIFVALVLIISMLPLTASAAISMSLSKNGADFIKGFEGFSAKAYWDYQQWTIGYGTRWDEEKYPEGDPDDKSTAGITRAQADEMFNAEVKSYVGYVNKFLTSINRSVTQNQFDALVSFTYNLGNVWDNYRDENGDKVFQLKTILTNGISKYTDAQIKTAFGNWCKAGGVVNQGLVRRRAAEAELFLTPDSTVNNGEAEVTPTTAALYELWRVDASSGLYLRAEANRSSSSVGIMPNNTEIRVVEKVQGNDYLWGKTTYNGATGWCALDYAEYISGSLVPPTTAAATTTTAAPTTTTTAATTEPTEPTTIILGFGDANVDGTVNAKDILLLRQYLAEWEVELSVEWTDVNVDGVINAKDLLLLRQYLAEWEVQLGQPQPTTEPTTTEADTTAAEQPETEEGEQTTAEPSTTEAATAEATTTEATTEAEPTGTVAAE